MAIFRRESQPARDTVPFWRKSWAANLRRLLWGSGPRFDADGFIKGAFQQLLTADYAELYRTKPNLRTVVNFRANQLASIPLHAYVRHDTTDRERKTDDRLLQALKRPNPGMTGFDLIFDLEGKLCVHGIAVWWLSTTSNGALEIRPLASEWIGGFGGGDAWAPEWVEFTAPNGAGTKKLYNLPGQSPEFVVFKEWLPDSPLSYASPIDTLKEVLGESLEAWEFRRQMWTNGARVGHYISRPAETKVWAPADRARFSADWANSYSGSGVKAGGTPILPDGMELHSFQFNAREVQWAETFRIGLETVCSVYGVNPVMIGDTQGTSHANVKQIGRHLLSNTLGPRLAMIEARINQMLVPWFADNPNLYVEFDTFHRAIAYSDPFEQIMAGASATGRAPLTSNEFRAMVLNLPPVDDGELLVTPLNVLVGGQASAHDSGSQNQVPGSADQERVS